MKDATPLAEIEYDEEIKKYFNLPELPKEQFITSFTPDKPRGWALEATPEGRLAGTISINSFEGNNKKKEIRIFLASEFQRRGIAYDATNYLIECFFSANWVESFIGVVHPQNTGSFALTSKLGFKFVGKAEDNINDVYELKNV